MPQTHKLTRSEAVEELNRYGINGPNLYLIDVIPIIEMIWADGKAQEGEIEILERYLQNLVNRINLLAGYETLTFKSAKKFVTGFLKKRPDPKLLKALRSLHSQIHLSSENETIKNEFRDTMLATCIDIASSSVIEYPFGPGERFNPDEKRCFFEILDSLSG